MTTTHRTYDLDASALKASLRGELIQPNDEGYDAARKVYNGMIDKHPALIARCADVADVIAAVNFGRENNLLVSDVVLADGHLVTADEQHHADLFWALRGGGGNFGVVTEFVFKANPVHTVYGGPMLWEMDQAPAVMKWYREFITQAPDDLNGFFAFLIV